MDKMTSADLNQQISKELRELRHATDNRSQERSWILAQLDNDKLEKEVLTLSVVALHILSALTKEDLTGIELATKLSVTRGGVTRAVQNLIKYQFLTTYQSESDKKKIFYHLTVKGRKVATIHDKMHKIMDIRLGQIFDKYNEQEKSIILSFLSDFNLTEAGLFDSE
jgi:DNA-binding MarR family transcriptional regulator